MVLEIITQTFGMIRVLVFINLLLLVACTGNPKPKPIKFSEEKRSMYVYRLDSLVRKENYTIRVEESDTLVKYRYIHEENNDKDFLVQYRKKPDVLLFHWIPFVPFKKYEYQNEMILSESFKLYREEDSGPDGNGPMYFDNGYGLLNIDVNGYNYIFLRSDINPSIADSVIVHLYDD